MITAALAQSVERRSRKAKVSGSIPEGGSITIHCLGLLIF